MTKAGQTEWVRATALAADWSAWAQVHAIKPKRAMRRVVLIGESVARAFLYDPELTAARGLATCLDAALGAGRVQVVDLARTGLDLAGLAALVESVFELEPDVVIVWAGNNWACSLPPKPPTDTERVARAAALRDHGLPGLARQREAELHAAGSKLVARAAELSHQHRVPFVFAVPEFNLRDFRERQPVPMLGAGKRSEWTRAHADAEAALRDGDVARAEAAAATMIELDGGICNAGLYLLAECKQRTGAAAEARALLERARDAPVWDPWVMTIPRSLAVTQEVLRGAAAHGLGVVDLPRAMSDALGGDLPGKEQFLDHCHLSLDGLRISLAAIARAVLPLVGGRADDPAVARFSLEVRDGVAADAHASAAIFNAHWAQPEAVIAHHCKRAIEASPTGRALLLGFTELAASSTPEWTSRVAERVLRDSTRCFERALFTALHVGQRARFMEETLAKIVADVTGDDAAEHHRADELGRPGTRVSLIDPRFAVRAQSEREAWRHLFDLDAQWGDWHRAYACQSRFALVLDGAREVPCRLTLRLPHAAGTCSVAVNGTQVIEVPVDATWRTVALVLPADALRRGINEVVLGWPAAELGDAFDRAVAALAAGRLPELYPVYGEIHAFDARL